MLETARTSVLAWLGAAPAGSTTTPFPVAAAPSSLEQATICEAGRREGRWDRTTARRLWHAFAAAHEGLDHPQGDGESEGGPASARPLQDREYGSLSRRRSRRCAYFGRTDGCVISAPASWPSDSRPSVPEPSRLYGSLSPDSISERTLNPPPADIPGVAQERGLATPSSHITTLALHNHRRHRSQKHLTRPASCTSLCDSPSRPGGHETRRVTSTRPAAPLSWR